MKKQIVSLAAVLCCALAGSAFAADNATMDGKAHKAEKDKISATYKADKKACEGMKPTPRTSATPKPRARKMSPRPTSRPRHASAPPTTPS